ncbi:neurogenic locus protein delta-like protein [Dinothrombium tinctorium]|uniref:Neurogenic locus protein delta-like protein n=1 Tax=Dinothrombium tinctorium TaxID=1965070 RepID=A0A443RRD8_9ACAR|nr:neurogenic locus protein delta-like protein [Dinothrombium tinctorium]
MSLFFSESQDTSVLNSRRGALCESYSKDYANRPLLDGPPSSSRKFAMERCCLSRAPPLAKCLYVAFVLLAIAIQQSHSSGVFELKLISFINKSGRDAEGNCCHDDRKLANSDGEPVCSDKCRTYFRICLKHYQKHIKNDEQCTFGKKITPIVANNSFAVSDMESVGGFENPLRFEFNFSWPGTFSLIIEAWHETTAISGATRSYGKDGSTVALQQQRQQLHGAEQLVALCLYAINAKIATKCMNMEQCLLFSIDGEYMSLLDNLTLVACLEAECFLFIV